MPGRFFNFGVPHRRVGGDAVLLEQRAQLDLAIASRVFTGVFMGYVGDASGACRAAAAEQVSIQLNRPDADAVPELPEIEKSPSPMSDLFADAVKKIGDVLPAIARAAGVVGGAVVGGFVGVKVGTPRCVAMAVSEAAFLPPSLAMSAENVAVCIAAHGVGGVVVGGAAAGLGEFAIEKAVERALADSPPQQNRESTIESLSKFYPIGPF